MKHFHAHIYFTSDNINPANELANKALLKPEFLFCKIYTKPVGPHPLGMIEVHFKENNLDDCRNWLQANRGLFSVLIHIDTGDDVIDHTENIEWLGAPVKIDFSFFELIKTHPDLKVHAD